MKPGGCGSGKKEAADGGGLKQPKKNETEKVVLQKRGSIPASNGKIEEKSGQNHAQEHRSTEAGCCSRN
jgi:hypothetical protein